MAYVMLLYHAVVKQPLSFLHTSLFPSLCSYFDSLRPHHSQKTYHGAATVQTASTAAADDAALTHLPTPEQLSSLIKARRSIFPKHMTGETVPQDSIATMLEAANWAPTHGRTEPWRFVVLGKAGMEAMQLLTEDIFRQQLTGRSEILQVQNPAPCPTSPEYGCLTSLCHTSPSSLAACFCRCQQCCCYYWWLEAYCLEFNTILTDTTFPSAVSCSCSAYL
jgi:hypothetical protein